MKAITVVARGNHRAGYRGVLVRGWDTPGEKTIWSCDHRHPTTGEARDCARGKLTELDIQHAAPDGAHG